MSEEVITDMLAVETALVADGSDDIYIRSTTFSEFARAKFFRDIYKLSLAIHSNVEVSAQLVAKAPIKLMWSKFDETSDEDRNELEKRVFDSLNEIGGAEFFALITRHLLSVGIFAAELVRDEDTMLPVTTAVLRAESLVPYLMNHQIYEYKYTMMKGASISYEPEKLLYCVNAPYDQMYIGQSPLHCAASSLDELKDLNVDLIRVATKMWKRSMLYQVDVSNMSEEDAKKFLNTLVSNEPGKSVAVSKKVEAQELKNNGDLTSLIEAVNFKKREINAVYGLPHVLSGTSNSADMNTLRPALSLFYDMSIWPLQRTIQRELTKKLVKPALEKMNLPDGRAFLEFAKISLDEFSQQVNSITQMVDKEIISDQDAENLLLRGGSTYV